MAAAARLAPDAVLLDVCLGDGSDVDLASALTRARPALAVLLVSARDYRDCDALLRECGAGGFVLKSDLGKADLAAFWPAPAAKRRSLHAGRLGALRGVEQRPDDP